MLCWGLAPAGDASCFAADPRPVENAARQANAPPIQADVVYFDDVAGPRPALAPAAAAMWTGLTPGPLEDPPRSLTLDGDGSGQLVLSGTNTFAGGTIVNNGTLIVDSATALPAAPQAQAPAVAAPPKAEAKPAGPAAKRGSLLGAIVEALGADRDAKERAARAAQDQEIRALEAEIRPQFQQFLFGELAFLRRVCKPDAKSFAEVAKAAKTGLQAPLREYATRFLAWQENPRGANPVDPRSVVQKMLLALAKEKFGPQKVQLYLQECDKRIAARKHAVVVDLVAMLDERLVLTAPQRAKLVQSLSASYENSWDQFAEQFGYGGQNVPSIPDKAIVSLLDDKQKSVWGQTKRQGGEYYAGQISLDSELGEVTEIQEIAHIVEEGPNGR